MNSLQRAAILRHFNDVISVYEEMCDDKLKELSTRYKEDHIDLKQCGYEFKLDLDKILIEIEHTID